MIKKKYIFAAVVFLIGLLFKKSEGAIEIGQLQCTENGVYPDDKLIGMVMQKCQPKLDDSRDLLIACVTKCMMKQLKGVTKKGKLKKSEASKFVTILPSEYHEAGKTKFDECYKSFQSKIKKESKCDSWIPFSSCFIGFAEALCKPQNTTAAPE